MRLRDHHRTQAWHLHGVFKLRQEPVDDLGPVCGESPKVTSWMRLHVDSIWCLIPAYLRRTVDIAGSIARVRQLLDLRATSDDGNIVVCRFTKYDNRHNSD